MKLFYFIFYFILFKKNTKEQQVIYKVLERRPTTAQHPKLGWSPNMSRVPIAMRKKESENRFPAASKGPSVCVCLLPICEVSSRAAFFSRVCVQQRNYRQIELGEFIKRWLLFVLVVFFNDHK
jgi:hypothetical protein